MKSNVPSTLRIMNKSLVLNIIRQNEPISRAKISKLTELTRATTSEIVQELISENLVYESGVEDGSLGRKGILLKYNRSHGFTVGVDIGGTKISLGLIDYSGELLFKKTLPTFKVSKSKEFIEILVKEIRLFIEENDQSIDKLHVVGIASPGIIDYKKGIVVEGSPNLPEWQDLNVSKEFESALGVPTIVENDVRAALIGEFLKGKCQHVHSAALISLGTGIGSALLIDGKIIRGAGNGAGEIGYMLFSREHLHQNWQDKGCFESLASGSGLLSKVKQDPSFQTTHSKQWQSSEEIFSSAKAGDPLAKQIVNEFVEYLAITINNMIATVNPEKIVLTGGMARSADFYLDKVNEYVRQHTFTKNHVDVEVTELFDEAALYGISILALNSIHPMIKFLDDVSII